MNRVEYWDSYPERQWPKSGLGHFDHRVCLRTVAQLLNKPKTLEVGIDNGFILRFCHDVFGSYTGVDIHVKPEVHNVAALQEISCPYGFFEGLSSTFWVNSKKDDVWDFIFIDGYHGSLGAYVDMSQAMLRLAPGGYILAHDIMRNPCNPGVGPDWAHDRLANVHGWYGRQLEGHAEGMGIYFRENE